MSVETLERWIRAVAELGYPMLVFAVAFEHVFILGLLVPGDVIIAVAGVLAARGALDPAAVALAVTVGIVVGLAASYALGERGGLPLIERWGPRVGVTPARLASLERHFGQHGMTTVFLAGMLAGVKNVLPALAGASRMPFGRFLVAGFAGFGLRASLELALGWVLGKNLERLAKALSEVGGWLATGVVVAVVAAVFVARRLRSGARRGDRVDIPPP